MMRETLAKWVDILAAALGAWVAGWLRLLLYAGLGMLAGVILGDPARIGGAVIGVAVVAELAIAAAGAFVDWQDFLILLYIYFWWPFRGQSWTRALPYHDIPTSSIKEARAWLKEQL